MKLLPASDSGKRIFRVPLALHPQQAVIDGSSARFKIVRAGRKFGKTVLAQKKALDWMGPPDSQVWFIGPTYRQTKLIVWEDFKRLIPAEALAKKPNESDLIFTLKNGSRLYLMGGDEPDSLRGPDPSAVILEEAAMMKPEVWHKVIRPNLMPRRAPALFISTPKGYNWFKDLEDKAVHDRMLGDTTWEVFHYTVYDNPYISKEEIERSRGDCDDNEAVWRQEYLAEYESSVGRVFNSFSDARHVRKVLLPSGVFPAYRAIDWGQRDDTGCLWGTIQGRSLVIYREHAENNLPPSSQAQIIVGRTSDQEKVVDSIIGHDAAREDVEMKGLTVKWHFFENGIRPIRHSSKDKKASRSMINQLIQEDRLVVSLEHCPKLRKQLLAYEWKDTAMEKTEDGDDDLVDALHYMVEMLQFELFMDRASAPELSMAQIWEDIRKEKAQQAIPKISLPGAQKTESLIDEGSPAGYL